MDGSEAVGPRGPSRLGPKGGTGAWGHTRPLIGGAPSAVLASCYYLVICAVLELLLGLLSYDAFIFRV